MNKMENVQAFLSNAIGNKLLPLQEKAIKTAKQSSKIQLQAPTGSGKTIAFLGALLQAKQTYNWKKALIIVPTRELALQIGEVFSGLKTNNKSSVCYGGHSFKSEVNSLKGNPAVIIGTPGRIADHIRRASFDPKEMNALIIDEVDKILEFGFKKEIDEITQELDELKFYMEVSATLSSLDENKELIKIVVENEMEPELSYHSITVEEETHKAEAVLNVLNQLAPAPTFVFLNHREAVDRIADYFAHKGLPVTVYHGGLDQLERERNLIRFRNGTASIMVVTDLAARGLDVADVEYIFHYQFPKDEASFVHRNGRTARMGAKGAVFVVQDDKDLAQISYLKNLSVTAFPVGTHGRAFQQENKNNWFTNKVTLSFSAGKKDKVNKIDLLGFLTKECKVPGNAIGKIDSFDHFSYVAIEEKYVSKVLQNKTKAKIKKKTVKIRVY